MDHEFSFKNFQFFAEFQATVMFVTLKWWQIKDVGDRIKIFVTIFNIGDFWRIKSINNISDQSQTSNSCHQHPHFVFNICHQHRCRRNFTIVSSNSKSILQKHEIHS